MKKLMFAAVAMMAGVAMADVESANIVGYNTVTIKPGFNMLSVNFKTVGAEDQGIALQDLFPGGGKEDTQFIKGANSTAADKIQVYNGDSYDNYYLYYTTKAALKSKNYFWVDDKNAITDKKFKNGDAFWFNSKNTKEVTAQISGEVELTGVKTITIQPGFNMIGSFFPDGLVLNDDYYTPAYWEKSGAVPGANSTAADKIQVYVNDGKGGGSYNNYFLYYTTKAALKSKNYQWVDDKNAVYTGDIINGGVGCWYNHKGNGMTLEIKNQFK